MPKINIDGKEYQVPVKVAELIQTLIVDANHYEAVNKDLLEELGGKGHRIVFGENSWSIQHPKECGPDKMKCEIHVAASDQLREPPSKLGVYKIWLEEGVLKYE